MSSTCRRYFCAVYSDQLGFHSRQSNGLIPIIGDHQKDWEKAFFVVANRENIRLVRHVVGINVRLLPRGMASWAG